MPSTKLNTKERPASISNMLVSNNQANSEQTNKKEVVPAPVVLLQHDYVIELTSAGPDKRNIVKLEDLPLSTTTKGSHVRKW